ncbi:Fic family protein [Persephonella sp.]|uniref:Fic family protein n=1 Tax=Persephonella sp. TaxID=2060922 RepID=UPI0025F2E1B6|nr:Fic family protein [Persephonella sp.]
MVNEELIKKRKKIIDELGGLPEPKIQNKEWLYLLKEETRNSILVEGYFISEKELKEVLSGNKPMTRTEEEAFNYFRTASFIYGLAYENYKQNEFMFGIPLIRQINKSLGYKGEFRKVKIKIAGAKFNPPDTYIEDWLRIFIKFIKNIKENFNKLAASHAFFEEIHPFEDGNGRTGRIILNYILISKGYPLVIIKGDDKSKQLYYKSLEELDLQIKDIFEKFKSKKPEEKEILKRLNNIHSKILPNLILEGLRESMDRIIIGIYQEKGAKLEPVSKLLEEIGYSSKSSRQLIKRGKIIAIKVKNKWMSTKEIIQKLL